MKSVIEKSLNFNKMIKVNFDGGNLTSDSGLLLYKEFDEKIGLSQSIQETLQVKDPVDHREHTNHDVVIQKIYQHISGYHTDDNADELKHDPMFTAILDKKQLASQPTLSRLNQKFDKETMKQLQRVNQQLNRRVQTIQPSDHFVFDLDSANFTTCGHQYGTDYNAHYQTNGYHPLVLFDGLTGDCIKAVLRAGNVYTSRNVVSFVGPVIKDYEKMNPSATIAVRGDSGFAVPKLYELCEEHEIKYAIRLKSNKRLTSMAQDIEHQIGNRLKLNNGASYVFYKEITYKAASWNKPRRVIVKLERPEGELLFRYSFIVTNLSYRPKNIVKFYQNRGTMENFIKEGKNGFAFDQLSSPDFYTNATKLQIALLAYNFANWFRRLCLPKSMNKSTIATVRIKLIKIAGKVINTARYTTFKLCSSCLYKKHFWFALKKIQGIPLIE